MEGECTTIAITTFVSPNVCNPFYAASSCSAAILSLAIYLCFALMQGALFELRALIEIHTPELICIVETWLCGSITDTEVGIPNYRLIKLDRMDMVVVCSYMHKPAL